MTPSDHHHHLLIHSRTLKHLDPDGQTGVEISHCAIISINNKLKTAINALLIKSQYGLQWDCHTELSLISTCWSVV